MDKKPDNVEYEYMDVCTHILESQKHDFEILDLDDDIYLAGIKIKEEK